MIYDNLVPSMHPSMKADYCQYNMFLADAEFDVICYEVNLSDKSN